MKHAIVCGLLAPTCSGNARSIWNSYFSRHQYDAFFDFYRCTGREDLTLRLSEMFLLNRRGYIVDKVFQEEIVPLLDVLEPSALRAGRVDSILNNEGVLHGAYIDDQSPEMRVQFWRFDT